MHSLSVRRVGLASALFSVGVAIASGTLGIAGRGPAILAAICLVTPWAIQATFIVAQMMPGGREMIPARPWTNDAWLVALAGTWLPLSYVEPLAQIAGSYAFGPIPQANAWSVLSLALFVGRLYQTGNYPSSRRGHHSA